MSLAVSVITALYQITLFWYFLSFNFSNIYIAPVQWDYSEALPTPTWLNFKINDFKINDLFVQLNPVNCLIVIIPNSRRQHVEVLNCPRKRKLMIRPI